MVAVRSTLDATSQELDAFALPDEAGAALLAEAAVKLNLTARGYHRVLKVSRTIADLEGAVSVRRIHIAEALTYRRRDPAAIGETGRPNGTEERLVY